MKKALIVLSLFALVGCKTANVARWHETYLVFYSDFTPYADKGFLFSTSADYMTPYEGCGIVEVIYSPEVIKAPQYPNERPGYRLKRCIGADCDDFYVSNPKPDSMIFNMYEMAVALGANAIIQFRTDDVVLKNDILDVETKKISGYAIRRRAVDVKLER